MSDIETIREALMDGGHVARLNAISALDRLQAQQPNAEPVAWMTKDGRIATKSAKDNMPSAANEAFTIPLYAHPPASKEPRLTVEQAMEAWRSTQTAWNLDEERHLRDRLAKAAKP